MKLAEYNQHKYIESACTDNAYQTVFVEKAQPVSDFVRIAVNSLTCVLAADGVTCTERQLKKLEKAVGEYAQSALDWIR